MNGTKSPLWSSVAILIGVVIGIFAVTTGKLRQSLLIAAMLVWILWTLTYHLFPMWRNYREQREYEARLQAKRKEMTAAGIRYDDLSRKLLANVSFRVSSALRSVYPNASWEWTMENPLRYVAEGGTGRIRVYNIPDYEYADVTLGSDAALSCSLVKVSPVKGNGNDGGAGQTSVNPEVWFENQAKEALIRLMNDLNTRGHSKLFLKEDGTACIQPIPGGEDIPQQVLTDFPARVYWPKLAEAMTKAGMATTVLDDRIQIAW